ncbi:MAG: 6-bladed beta-propeller [Bacteroidetes bacterium]|nr:MAG: 6-bladed beta-propeller [Bacteroidota bacterium]
MKRREFTKTTALAAAALSIPNINFGKAQEELILGHDKFKYKIVKNWGVDNLVNTPVADCHEMVQDSKKRLIFCTTEVKNNIIILDKKGKLIKTWGNDFPGVHGLTLNNANGEEFLYLTDTVKKEVYKTTIDGKVLLTLKYPTESGIYSDPEKMPFVPTETAIAPNGDIYVADGYGSSHILVYDVNGKFKNIFAGKSKEGDDKLIEAHGVCIDTRDKNNPKVIATSRKECGFKYYTMDGKLISSHYYKGSFFCRPIIKGENLFFPVIWSEFDESGKNAAWLSKTGHLVVFDKNNKLLSAPGVDTIEYENGKPKHMHQSAKVKGTFMHCHDLCIDDEDSIYIPQWNSDKTFPLKLERV